MKILLVATRYPWPSWRGDQLRSAEFSSLLSDRHAVTLLVPEPPVGSPAPPEGTRVETYRVSRRDVLLGGPSVIRSGLPLQSALHHQNDLHRRLEQLAPRHDLVLLQLVRLIECALLFGRPPLHDLGIPYAVDFIDSLALNFERRARFDHPLLRTLWRFEAKRLERAERRMMDRAALSLFVCDRDLRMVRNRTAAGSRSGSLPEERHRVIRLSVEPGLERRFRPSEKQTLVLSGNLGYFVNRDATIWFLDQVWNRLSIERPDVDLVVAGHRPPAALVARCRRSRVELIASPPDLRQIVRRGAISVAPMRAGSGVPVKILEAWAESKAVVASPWAAAGTDGLPGVHLAVADAAGEWLETLHRVIDSLDEQEALARRGFSLVRDLHARTEVQAALLEAFEHGF